MDACEVQTASLMYPPPPGLWSPRCFHTSFTVFISAPPTVMGHHHCDLQRLRKLSRKLQPLHSNLTRTHTRWSHSALCVCLCRFDAQCLFNALFCPLSSQYSSAGCLLSLYHSEKPDHEEVCEFRPYTCPCPGATCKWHGSLEAVMPHLMHAHKSITTLQVSTTALTLQHSQRHCCGVM